MALAEKKHHTSRGQTNARAGDWGREMNFRAMNRAPLPPPSHPSPPSTPHTMKRALVLESGACTMDPNGRPMADRATGAARRRRERRLRSRWRHVERLCSGRGTPPLLRDQAFDVRHEGGGGCHERRLSRPEHRHQSQSWRSLRGAPSPTGTDSTAAPASLVEVRP